MHEKPLAVLACFAALSWPVTMAWADGPTAGPTLFKAMLKQEAEKLGLPPAVAEAVAHVESGFDPTKIGGVGEIGLMQVRPGTAAMMGFRGSELDLALPATNIHFGVTYLAGAWRLANGDLCRALMKYRAGHGEEVMTPLSVEYCARARSYLASAAPGQTFGTTSLAFVEPAPLVRPGRRPGAIPKLDIRLRGAAFWSAHDARVRAITAQIERRWKRFASR